MRQNNSDAIDKGVQGNIICSICNGYLVDAVTLTECLHFFCRSCLLHHLKADHRCPKCFLELSKDLNSAFCTDQLLQNLVYKLVPNFFWHQLRKRHRALKKGRKGKSEHRKNVTQQMAEFSSHLCSPNEKISLVLEYVPISSILSENRELESGKEPEEEQRTSFKRYFRCPARTRLEHLKKLLEAKLAMNESYAVYFIDSTLKTLLKEDYCLQDLVYINSYDRQQPLPLLFTLARLNLDEDKPPILDLQIMPQLMPETPSLQKHSPNTTTTPEEQPQIPKMSVCLSSTAFESGSVHPPIITTCSSTSETSSQITKKKRKSNAPVKKTSENGTTPNTATEKKPEIIKTSPPSTSAEATPPSPPKTRGPELAKTPFPPFTRNFPGFNPNVSQLPPYMTAALLANSPFGNSANFNMMNGNFMWPNTSFNQPQPQMHINGNNGVKKSPPKKARSRAEMGQIPSASKEFNLLMQQQQKQIQQMFGQSAIVANGQLQMAAQSNASNAFFTKSGGLNKAVVTSSANQLKLPTISASGSNGVNCSAVSSAGGNNSPSTASGFGFKDPRMTGANNCAKQTLATT